MKKNRITESIILALTTLISAFVWIGLKDFLFKKGGFVLPLAGLFIMCILLSLSWILLKSKIILTTTLLIILFGYFIAFGFALPYIIAALISLAFLFFGSCHAMNEKNVRIKIKISKILKLGMPSLLTGLILLIAVSYYFSPMSIKQFEVPRPLFDSIMKIMPFPSTQANLSSLIPGLGNIDIKKLESIQNENFDLQSMLKTMPAGSIVPNENDLYELINQSISASIEPYKEYLAVGLAVSLFFMLKTLSIPFMWIAIFVSWLIFKLLVSLNAIKIHEKSVLQEIIE